MPNPNFQFGPGIKQLGLSYIAFATVCGLDPQAPFSDSYMEKLDEMGQWATGVEEQELDTTPILQGYVELIRKIGRSPRKFPPSARALINIIKHRKKFPHVLPLVDIYNITTLTSYLSLGVHDLSKLEGTIQFRISSGGEVFYPIGGGEKTTAPGDFVYADNKTVLAWLDVRDSELVKVTDKTRDIIIIVQGNLDTSLAYRMRALEVLCQQIVHSCGGTAMLGYAEIANGLTTWLPLDRHLGRS